MDGLSKSVRADFYEVSIKRPIRYRCNYMIYIQFLMIYIVVRCLRNFNGAFEDKSRQKRFKIVSALIRIVLTAKMTRKVSIALSTHRSRLEVLTLSLLAFSISLARPSGL